MHIYEKDGKKYPSVTTIIHILGNDEIIRWANSLGFRHKKYDEELDKYAVRGTKVHDYLHSIVDPNYTLVETPKDIFEQKEIEAICSRFKLFLMKYDWKTVFTEKTIISENLGYAGTLDWLAVINNFLLVNDFKTSKTVRFSMLLQLGGYNNLLKEIGYNADGGSIILANNKLCSMYPINKTELEYYSEAFNKLAEYYHFIMDHTMSPDFKLLEDLTKQ